MANKKSSAREIVIGIIIILIVLALASVAGLIIRQVLNPEEKGSVIGVSYNGKAINNGDSVGLIYSGAEFDVVATGTYTIIVKAIHTDKNNFEFSMGESETKKPSWHQVGAVTSGFEIEEQTDVLNRGFSLNFKNLDDVLSKSFGIPVTGADGAAPNSELFELTLVGADEKPFTFRFGLAYPRIIISPNGILL